MKQRLIFTLVFSLFAKSLFAAVPVGTNISKYPNTNIAPQASLLLLAVTNDPGAFPRTNYNILVTNFINQATSGLATINYVTTTSNFLATSSIDVKTNPVSLILQHRPVSGSQWFVGTNGTPNTSGGARSGLEYNSTNQSMRVGSVANVGVNQHHYLRTSNFWDEPNVGLSSYAYGADHLVNATNSTIGGGRGNLIYTNAYGSTIGGGIGHAIHTNSAFSTIAGGGNATLGNTIRIDSPSSFIGGGGENMVRANAQHTTIGGGQANVVDNGNEWSFMGGGLNNTVSGSAGTTKYSVVSGGQQNVTRGSHTTISGGRFNNMQQGSDFSTVSGGDGNIIGSGGFGTLNATITGGGANLIDQSADYGVVSGRGNTISGAATNGTISGGAFHVINNKFGIIPGGERNTVSGNYSFSLGGASNSVTAARAGAIGMNVTNTVAGTVIASEFRQYNTPEVISGTGNGNTNYTLNVNTPEMILGSSNVNILASMSWIDGKTHKTSLSITNDSPDNWGLSFSQVSNRVFWSGVHGTNVPTLTNNTRLVLNLKQTGSNIWVTYDSFSPAK